jgi:hypothetical protein
MKTLVLEGRGRTMGLFFYDVPQVEDTHHRKDTLFVIHHRDLFDVA